MLLHDVSEEASSPRFASSTPATSELLLAEEEKKESSFPTAGTAAQPEEIRKESNNYNTSEPQILKSRSGDEGENPEVIVPVKSQ